MSFFKAVPPSRLKEFLTNVLGKSFLGAGLAKPRDHETSRDLKSSYDLKRSQ